MDSVEYVVMPALHRQEDTESVTTKRMNTHSDKGG